MPFALFSYDVVNDKRRTKLSKFLQDYGQRVQYSVFEVFEDETELKMLYGKLQEFIDPEEDSLRMYTLCQSCRKKTMTTGKENKHNFESEYIVI
jgi:CRISPR-associated protein Cas2